MLRYIRVATNMHSWRWCGWRRLQIGVKGGCVTRGLQTACNTHPSAVCDDVAPEPTAFPSLIPQWRAHQTPYNTASLEPLTCLCIGGRGTSGSRRGGVLRREGSGGAAARARQREGGHVGPHRVLSRGSVRLHSNVKLHAALVCGAQLGQQRGPEGEGLVGAKRPGLRMVATTISMESRGA